MQERLALGVPHSTRSGHSPLTKSKGREPRGGEMRKGIYFHEASTGEDGGLASQRLVSKVLGVLPVCIRNM